jgi:hypothetical protein
VILKRHPFSKVSFSPSHACYLLIYQEQTQENDYEEMLSPTKVTDLTALFEPTAQREIKERCH